MPVTIQLGGSLGPRRLSGLAIAILACATSAKAFVTAGETAVDSRWQTTASGPTGDPGDPVTLTWSFVPDGTLVEDFDTFETRPSDLIEDLDAQFGAGPGGGDLTQRPWFRFFDDSFNRWAELSGVTYLYEPFDTTDDHGQAAGQLGVRGDVRIGGIPMDGPSGVLAYNFFPAFGGDMAIDTDELPGLLGDPTDDFRAIRNTITHEAGHGLGLEHLDSDDANFLMEPLFDLTIDGPQNDDLRGVQWLYGDVFEKGANGRNDTSAAAEPLGVLFPGRSLAIGTQGNTTVIGPNDVDFLSISNENDVDFFSFQVRSPVDVDLSMTPLGAVYDQNGEDLLTSKTSDLSVALIDADGQTLLAESASAAIGLAERITDVRLDPNQTYFVRVSGPGGQDEQLTQLYRLDLSADVVLPELLGDFNNDGVVNAIDYGVWRDQRGGFVTPFTGVDHNGSGFIDAGDYDLWVTNFGATLAAASVPEPTTAALTLMLGAVGVAAGRRAAS